MDTTEWLVIGLGLVAIGWINWWFLLARRAVTRPITTGSEQIVLPDSAIERYLPAHRRTSVELVPEQAGTYELACGVRMLRGRRTVEAAEAER